MSNFGEIIRKIDKQIVKLIVLDDLFGSPKFRGIYENSASYLSEALAVLRSPEFTDHQKVIIVRSMQGLDLPRFLLFANKMLRLLESGLISQRVFELAVFTPPEWDNKLAENYDLPDVTRFLHRILKSEQVDAGEKKYIRERILTGKARLYFLGIRYWKETGMKSRSKEESAQAMSDFVARIEKIEARSADPTWMGGLFGDPEFQEIHAHPADYTNEASRVLKGPGFTDRQKMIVVLSLQGIEMPWFLLIAEHMLLLEAGLVSYDIFELAVFPSYDWNTKLIENYEEHDVARFLRSVLESEKVGDRRKEIIRREILTGKAKSHVLDMRNAGLLR